MCSSHGVSADLQGKHFTIADDVTQADAFAGLRCLDRLSGSDPPEQGKAVRSPGFAARRKHVDGAAAVVRPLQQALLLQVGDVLVHGGQRLEAETACNFFKGWGVSVALDKIADEVQHLFLPAGHRHGSIIANKKRIYKKTFPLA
jgi:hypothetical protein